MGDGFTDPFAGGELRVGTEEGSFGVGCLGAACAVASEPAWLDEVVVLEEAHEHGGQHPRDGDLGAVLVAPGGEVRTRTIAAQRRGVVIPPILQLLCIS